MIEVLPRSSWSRGTTSAGVTPPSLLLRTHAPVLNPPRASVVSSTPGLCRLLSVPAGRRTFPTLCCASFPACLDPYPGGSCGARTRFFPHDSGLPPVRTGSALHNVRTATSVRRPFRGCSHSLMFRPAGLLATPVAPTDITHAMWQPWLLRPSLSRFVTSPCPGYANRPNRAIDGMGTFTPSDTQPCRLLPYPMADTVNASIVEHFRT
jgi:hypothetical protein